MCKIFIEKVPRSYPMAIQFLRGYEVEAVHYGPFKLPPLSEGSAVTVRVGVFRCPIAVNPTSFWVVEVTEIVRVLLEHNFELVAYRFKRRYGAENAFPLITGDPELVLKEVA